jgi:hypothetical protein
LFSGWGGKPVEDKKSATGKFGTTGFDQLNKKIQEQLSPDAKDKKRALKAAEKAAAEAEKGAKMGKWVGEGVREVKAVLETLTLGWGE